jgi:hypothetical protein
MSRVCCRTRQRQQCFRRSCLSSVGPVPLELREFQGAEDPKTDQKLNSLLHRKQQEWIETAKSQAQRLLENTRLQLGAKGVSENTVTSELVVLDHKEDFIGEILKKTSSIKDGKPIWVIPSPAKEAAEAA